MSATPTRSRPPPPSPHFSPPASHLSHAHLGDFLTEAAEHRVRGSLHYPNCGCRKTPHPPASFPPSYVLVPDGPLPSMSFSSIPCDESISDPLEREAAASALVSEAGPYIEIRLRQCGLRVEGNGQILLLGEKHDILRLTRRCEARLGIRPTPKSPSPSKRDRYEARTKRPLDEPTLAVVGAPIALVRDVIAYLKLPSTPSPSPKKGKKDGRKKRVVSEAERARLTKRFEAFRSLLHEQGFEVGTTASDRGYGEGGDGEGGEGEGGEDGKEFGVKFGFHVETALSYATRMLWKDAVREALRIEDVEAVSMEGRGKMGGLWILLGVEEKATKKGGDGTVYEFDLGGGKRRLGEAATDCAWREAKEELRLLQTDCNVLTDVDAMQGKEPANCKLIIACPANDDDKAEDEEEGREGSGGGGGGGGDGGGEEGDG